MGNLATVGLNLVYPVRWVSELYGGRLRRNLFNRAKIEVRLLSGSSFHLEYSINGRSAGCHSLFCYTSWVSDDRVALRSVIAGGVLIRGHSGDSMQFFVCNPTEINL
jgi:hypothetical protein